MRRWVVSLAAVVTFGAACTDGVEEAEPAVVADAGLDAALIDGVDAALVDAELVDAELADAAPPDQLDAEALSDAAPERDAATQDAQQDVDAGQCVSGPAVLGVATAEVLVVFDASGSTRPVGPLDCRSATSISDPNYFTCFGLGIDCAAPQFAGGPYCGGAPIDRFGAAAEAVHSIAVQLEQQLPVGLMVFPGPSTDARQCTTGEELVVPRLRAAAEIATKLDATTPAGSSPVAATLRQALMRIQARAGNAVGETRRTVVLLVTDGAPSCASSASVALNDTLTAIDELRAARVPTLVLADDDRRPASEQAALTTLATRAGAPAYWRTSQAAALAAEIERVTHAASCWFELETVPPAGASVRVTLDGVELVQDAPGGYTLHQRRVTLQGQACEIVASGQHMPSAALRCP